MNHEVAENSLPDVESAESGPVIPPARSRDIFLRDGLAVLVLLAGLATLVHFTPVTHRDMAIAAAGFLLGRALARA